MGAGVSGFGAVLMGLAGLRVHRHQEQRRRLLAEVEIHEIALAAGIRPHTGVAEAALLHRHAEVLELPGQRRALRHNETQTQEQRHRPHA
jgi:hypothetical protein